MSMFVKSLPDMDQVCGTSIWIRYLLCATNAPSEKSKNGRFVDSIGGSGVLHHHLLAIYVVEADGSGTGRMRL